MVQQIKVKNLKFIPESEKFAPEVFTAVNAKKNEDGKVIPNCFIVSIIHPNTKEVLYTEEIITKDFMEAMEYVKKIKENQFSLVETEYQEVKFIPAPRKGKTKLYTEKGVIEGDMSAEDFESLGTNDPEFIVDADFLEFDNHVKNKIEKVEKTNKNKSKNKKVDVKSAKKGLKSTKKLKKGAKHSKKMKKIKR